MIDRLLDSSPAWLATTAILAAAAVTGIVFGLVWLLGLWSLAVIVPVMWLVFWRLFRYQP